MFDPERVQTVTFDSFSTVVDIDTVEEALAEYVEDPEPVSRLWRSRSLAYIRASNFLDRYQPFYEMNRDALEYALDVHDVDVPPAERDAILATYHNLEPFEDVRPAMERLRDAGYPLYIVSNGNPEMLDSMIESADIGDLIADTVSADEIETFKLSPKIYRHAAARVGTPVDAIAHVTAGTGGCAAAQYVGMQGVWVNRKDEPWESYYGSPDLTIDDFHDLADALEA